MKPFQQLLVAAPSAALLPVVLAPASSLANDVQLNLDTFQGYSIAQAATTIRDFSDVYPTDWAYQALSELVETYGCVSGFGDGTFRGNQPMTRFQMAAVLSSCLDSISAKMDMMGEEMSAMEDMETLERLVASFEEELITLKGSVDGLDAKVSELEDSQFSTTTKASFKIATDFTYFASDDMKAKNNTTEDNSGLSLSSKAEVKFKTSFTGSDKLTFKIKGDVMSVANDYLVLGNFYDSPSGHTAAEFSGFKYETSLELGGMTANLIFGTDYNDFDGIVGLDTYYGGGGFDGYGFSSVVFSNVGANVSSIATLFGVENPDLEVGFGDFGDAGAGFDLALLSSDAGKLTASASYAVDGGHAANQMGNKGIFGEDTNYSGSLALNWDGALFGGNDAMFTVAYRYVDHNNILGTIVDAKQNDWKFVAGAYITDTLSVSGSYAFGTLDSNLQGVSDDKFAQWMIAANLEDAIFPGNSAGIAYGTTPHQTNNKPKGYKVPTVLELYYSFNVNDNLEIPIYLDFISNSASSSDSDAFAIAVRPTLTF